MSLGQIIRKRRQELRFTLDEVAAKTGFSKPYLSTVETGKVNNPPSDNCLRKLEDVMKFEKGLLLHIAHIESMPPDIRSDYDAADAENRRFKEIIRKIVNSDAGIESIEDMLSQQELDNIQRPTPDGAITAGQLVPVINSVSAGYPIDFDDLGYPVGFADDYVRCLDQHDPNAFAVRVVGDSMEPKFLEGEIVIFSPAVEVNSGDDCFVRFAMPHESTFKRVFFEQGKKVRLQPRNDKYAPEIVDGNRINGLYRAVVRYEKL
jgi:phage repressor protein C with HTH and peptisase S24 domain